MNGITRREFHRIAIAGACLLTKEIGGEEQPKPQAFIHPGILHTAEDLERMKQGVRKNLSPIAEGFEKLRSDPYSQLDYVAHTFGQEIGRNPSVDFPAFDDDANAAYQCSLMAAITGDKRYAAIARNIVLGWSESLHTVSGADAVLMAGLGPFKLINAAEILRSLGELDNSSAARCAEMLKRAILPVIADFAPFANGNWDTAAIKTMLAIAVFCDDRVLFERALLYYLHGDGDGRLTHYIYENGQCQESGRDQQHTQLGLAHMGDACEIAWNQGMDLYGAEDNRLLRGFEYTAAYNLGDEVAFKPDVDRTGKYRHTVNSPRGSLRPVYEQIYAHYHVRRGLATPAVGRAVDKLRPEGAARGADHTGFGTLLYVRAPSNAARKAPLAAPAAVYAEGSEAAIDVSWPAPRDGASFSIERAEPDGLFRIIKTNVRATKFRDVNVKRGRQYRYRVAVQGIGTDELFSEAVDIVAGMPAGWSAIAIGVTPASESVRFDGKVLSIYAAGNGWMTPSDEGLFVAAPVGCNALQALFVPQTASQFVQFGLSWRSGTSADSPCASLIIRPETGNPERHGWRLGVLSRSPDGKVSAVSDFLLARPVVDYGRLMGSVGLRLRRSSASILAEFSTDGAVWKDAGSTVDLGGGLMGMIVSSGITGVDTCVRFGSLTIDQQNA